jgi:hypothetical protein
METMTSFEIEESSFEKRFYQHGTAIRAMVNFLLKKKDWKQSKLAFEMGVLPPSLSRMLGFADDQPANLTLESISKMEEAFGERILGTPIEIHNEVTRNLSLATELYEIALQKSKKADTWNISPLRVREWSPLKNPQKNPKEELYV